MKEAQQPAEERKATPEPRPEWTLEHVQALAQSVLKLDGRDFVLAENWSRAVSADSEPSALLRSMPPEELQAFCGYISSKVGRNIASLQYLMGDYEQAKTETEASPRSRAALLSALNRFFFGREPTAAVQVEQATMVNADAQTVDDPIVRIPEVSAKEEQEDHEFVRRFPHLDLNNFAARPGQDRLTAKFDKDDHERQSLGGGFAECYKMVAAGQVPERLMARAISEAGNSSP